MNQKWSEKEYADYMQKQDGPEPESVLQKKIVAWARAQGYPCLSFRQSKRARGFLTPGWPDITLCLPPKLNQCQFCLQENAIKSPRVVFIELKSQRGSLTNEQSMMKLMLMQLKIEFYVCKSWKRFKEIVGIHEFN